MASLNIGTYYWSYLFPIVTLVSAFCIYACIYCLHFMLAFACHVVCLYLLAFIYYSQYHWGCPLPIVYIYYYYSLLYIRPQWEEVVRWSPHLTFPLLLQALRAHRCNLCPCLHRRLWPPSWLGNLSNFKLPPTTLQSLGEFPLSLAHTQSLPPSG